ncbi:MAG: 4-(cytidine 5'-diphospho)-2-C-methyl-D-erythritol kinase [Rhodocyclaceae bacterium]|nr:4-(cytidine 5'-diphospho)-2-C-methyl-D-erythritol kinase [Rhodocyclaceae bacterium]
MERTVSERLCCPAPAKINLFLHVVGRRDDGYHLLQSVFRLIDWADEITVADRDDGRIARVQPLPGVDESLDLTIRAARLLQQATGVRRGATIGVDKRLPMGGGIGGGSSDAATVMLALNRLWGLGLRRSELMALGLKLGADVPFFLFGRDAFVEGIGEQLKAVNLAPAWYVVIAPQVSVPTPAIFSDPDLTRDTAPIRMADFAASTTRNDLEPVVRLRYPEVDRAIRWLERFSPARMSGSGSCLFAQFPSQGDALQVVAQCPVEWTAKCVQSLPGHPLRDWADD